MRGFVGDFVIFIIFNNNYLFYYFYKRFVLGVRLLYIYFIEEIIIYIKLGSFSLRNIENIVMSNFILNIKNKCSYLMLMILRKLGFTVII